MMIIGMILLHVCTALVSGQQCPTWFVRGADNKCVCGRQINIFLQCSNATNKTRIFENNCLTYNNDTEHFGACPYNVNSIKMFFNEVPSDVSKLDEEMCGPLNRTGLLCSHCQPGLGPAVFSYYRECKECLPQPFGWLLYFVRLTVPLTLLCVLVIAFRINIAHPVLNSFVVVAQLGSIMLSNDAPFLVTEYNHDYSVTKLVGDIIGVFNLDFFVFLLPSFCISENMSTLTVIAMEYLMAFYPILFTLAAYWLITLHDRGCKIVVICWRPFHKCLARCRRSWELKGSVVNAFTTFLVLSYSKFCSISFDLLKPTPIFDKYGNVTYSLYFAADFSLDLYIPLAILATIITIVMVILPFLFLLFYQNHLFQKCLHCCNTHLTLIHEVANTIQSYFKNGTSMGTRDFRWAASIYLLMRIIAITSGSQNYDVLVKQITCLFSLVLILGIRPYKKNCYNYLDAYIVTALLTVSFVYIYQLGYRNVGGIFPEVVAIGFGIVYVLLLVIWGLYSTIRCCGPRCYHLCWASQQTTSNEDSESLPHRMSDPHEYEPLLTHTN